MSGCNPLYLTKGQNLHVAKAVPVTQCSGTDCHLLQHWAELSQDSVFSPVFQEVLLFLPKIYFQQPQQTFLMAITGGSKSCAVLSDIGRHGILTNKALLEEHCMSYEVPVRAAVELEVRECSGSLSELPAWGQFEICPNDSICGVWGKLQCKEGV